MGTRRRGWGWTKTVTKQPTTELGKPIFIQTADSIIEHDAKKFGG